MHDLNFETPHETTLDSHFAFRGSSIHIRIDDVRLPSGRVSNRVVLEHPGAVAIVALTTNDEVILVRQWRYAIQGPLLEIPAGTREPDELPIETAKRELIEETGYEAEEIEQIAHFYTSAGYSNEEMFLFRASGCVPILRPIDHDEVTEVDLVPLAEVAALIAPSGPIHDAKSMIGILSLLRPVQ